MPPRKKLQPVVDVETWDRRFRAFRKALRMELDDYNKHSDWFANKFGSSVEVPDGEGGAMRAKVSSLNMINRIVRARSSWLLTTPPFMVAKPEAGFGEDGLSDTLTVVGNDIAENTGLFYEGERWVQDFNMAPFAVMKIGYDANIDVDESKLEVERQAARDQNRLLMAGQPVRAIKGQNHSARIEIHEQQLEIWEESKEFPKAVRAATKTLIEQHKKLRAEEGDRRYEEVRDQRVFIRQKDIRRIAFDLWSTDLRSLNWAGEEFMRDATEVVSNPKYTINKDTVPGYEKDKKVEEWASPTHHAAKEEWEVDLEDALGEDGTPRLTLREMVDYKNMQVVTYVLGAKKPLDVAFYWLGKILKGVPYEVEYDIPHPKKIIGVSPIKSWEDQQKDLTILSTVIANLAKQQSPKRVVNAQTVNLEQLKALQSSIVGGDVMVDNLDPGDDIRRHIMEMPQAALTQEILYARDQAKRACEEGSLMGIARLGGGERAETATASAITAESNDQPTKKSAGKVDAFFQRLFAKAIRIAMALYTVPTIRRIAGEKGVLAWRRFSLSEITDDRGIEIKVGSMRRESTDVEIKLMGDLLAMTLSHPAFAQLPALQIVSNRLMDYLFTLHGAPIDLSDIEKSIKENPEAFTAPEEEEGGGPGVEGGGGAQINDIAQGVQNVAGGGDSR